MGNLKTIFTNKFWYKYAPTVFHELHWGKRLLAVLTMKTKYCRKNNLNLINPNKRSSKNGDRREELFLSILLVCNFYASHSLHINIVTVVLFFMNIVVIDYLYRTVLGYFCSWEGNCLEPSVFTFSTHDIIWWVVQVNYCYQNMMTLEWKLSKITTDNIVLQFKVWTGKNWYLSGYMYLSQR